MIQFKSIATKTLLQMALRIGFIISIGCLAGYFHMILKAEDAMKENVGRYMEERRDREKVVFDNAELNHSILKKEFIRLYTKYQSSPETAARFDALTNKFADGAIRSPDSNFDGKTQTGIFIGKGQAITKDFQARILAAYDVTNRMGIAYHGAFQDTYFTFPENGIVLFWPEFPRWVFNSKADLDITAEEYHLVSTPEKNPQRKTAWTGLFLDEVSNIWMVTAATPIYVDGKYVASIHHDVMVNEILNRTIENRLSDADSYYIFRGDGRLILHPDHQKEIQEMKGLFDINQSKDETLKSQFQQIMQMHSKSDVFETFNKKDYLAVAKIEGPDWYLVTSYPKRVAQNQAAGNSIFVLVAGLFSLLLEVLILFLVLKKQVSQPLIQLIHATNEIAHGKLQKPIDLHREDELGTLAKSFNHMVRNIQERDQKLEFHAKDLERLVVERTRELDEQKLINLQASKMSALGEMAGGIAHEINTPLATIQLLTSQLNHEIKNDIPDLDTLSTQVQRIENTVERVAKIVKGLKTFARDGSSDPLTPTKAQDIVRDTIDLCHEQLTIHKIDLRLNIPPQEILLLCRSVQISQVLLNLISNAQDAIENLPEKWIEISVREDDSWTEFKVTDSGHGISKENQDKIFQPFFTTKGVGKGTGMGLSISLGIIKAHKGQLSIDPNSHHTCFIMRFPRSQSLAA